MGPDGEIEARVEGCCAWRLSLSVVHWVGERMACMVLT